MGGGGVLERGVSDFCHKNGRVGKIGGVVSKKEGITYFHTNPFQCYLSECLVCVCLCVFVLFIYTSFSQYYLCFTGITNLALQHLINRYITFTTE